MGGWRKSHIPSDGPLPRGSCARAQAAPDQAPHLDALIGGIIVLLNMMRGKAYVGVYLNSGGCINALKKLAKRDYKEFEVQFKNATTADGEKLYECMKGGTYQENLDMAWDAYAETKLNELGFTERFKRAYIELDEFEMFLGSMSVYHFGAMYPCFVPLVDIPADSWHLRWHLYTGNRQVRVAEAFAESEEFVKANEGKIVTDEPVADHTIDIFDLPDEFRGLQTALRRLV